MSQFFITGTDTEVGKTYVTSLLLKYLVSKEKKALGFKPIAAGAEEAFGELVNEDALTLMEAANVHGTYEQINPFCFAPPIAPHIAASRVDVHISKQDLTNKLADVSTLGAEFTMVEGAGGWALPINDTDFLYTWVAEQNLPVILVVGMKLGCLNHAFLTAQAIEASGAKCVGWIANQIDPNMAEYDANLETLKQRLDFPLLAVTPYSEEKAKMQVHSALNSLLGV
ncbi:dethiobiotin synthase [Pseudoalteromonas sp. Of7M-16]|uniref:dethiobiotin synthase n=1 Tax=Pseudoalteromonas sp. Of7M-16 TaxID=2917756 RepID=UPI001EF65591|nr:dethiobiotin synthase [Pseudoalteromonas sp. Of7M-16]MCG7547591.1 dethiobiotin synthase [Pseudoalteromonas sp. Of7M-16]